VRGEVKIIPVKALGIIASALVSWIVGGERPLKISTFFEETVSGFLAVKLDKKVT
jgi:hypothetical protein